MTYAEHRKNVGKTFGMLTITGVFVRFVGGMNRPHYNYNCSCGNSGTAIAYNVYSGKTVSCGCFVTIQNKKLRSRTTHGMKGSPEYKAYMQAKTRCTNVNNPDYDSYGGRGIMFLFNSFEEFFKEIGNKPSSVHELDRKNNNGHYGIGNVRWVTHKENCNNRRNNSHYKL